MTQAVWVRAERKYLFSLLAAVLLLELIPIFSTNVFRYLPKIIISKIQFAKRSQVVNKAKKYLFLLVENIHITFYYN